ncbi:MAG: aminotransferase class IV family protein [Candidatus Marinimicrobia bacterium]|nr:aminotransferase class IV family protein [Candidatus Neomarinimicrobiota bacterium]
MYPLLESIRIENGIVRNLSYHQRRLERTFLHVYGEPAPFRLEKLIKFPKDLSADKIKLRFLYNKTSFQYETEKYRSKNIKTLKIVEDDTIDYCCKKTDRRSIDRLMTSKGECDDILIVKNGFITDASSANIVFFDGKEWLTPDTPLLEGTCRARLLESGKIKEATIRVEQLPLYQSFCLINAMMEGFGFPLPITNIKYEI